MPKLGITSALYYRSSGNFGTPTWTALTDIGDLAVNAQWDVAEANTRASRIKSESKTLLGLEVTGRLKSQDASASYNAVVEAFLSGTSNIDILVLDGRPTRIKLSPTPCSSTCGSPRTGSAATTSRARW
jgi:hypothetical protein